MRKDGYSEKEGLVLSEVRPSSVEDGESLQGLPEVIKEEFKKLSKKTQEYLCRHDKKAKKSSLIEDDLISEEEDRRRDEYVPSEEDLSSMTEAEIEITTWNTLYFWLSNSLDIDFRLKERGSEWGEYAKKIMDNLWSNRQNPETIEMFDEPRLERFKKRMEEISEQLADDPRYEKLYKMAITDQRMLEREKRELDELSWKKRTFELSDEYRKLVWEMEDVENYLSGESTQRERQLSLAYELRYFSGSEFESLFRKVVLDFALNGKTKMLWQGAEEAYLEIDEAVKIWGVDHANDEAIVKKPKMEYQKRLETLADSFWKYAESMKWNWKSWDRTTQSSHENQMKVVMRILERDLVS